MVLERTNNVRTKAFFQVILFRYNTGSWTTRIPPMFLPLKLSHHISQLPIQDKKEASPCPWGF